MPYLRGRLRNFGAARLMDVIRPSDETADEVLANGSILELVGDQVENKQPRLLRRDGENAIVRERSEFNGKTYVPVRLD